MELFYALTFKRYKMKLKFPWNSWNFRHQLQTVFKRTHRSHASPHYEANTVNKEVHCFILKDIFLRIIIRTSKWPLKSDCKYLCARRIGPAIIQRRIAASEKTIFPVLWKPLRPLFICRRSFTNLAFSVFCFR